MADQEFPTLEAKLLSGERVTFPDVAKGQVAFISMVFEKRGKYMKPQLQSNAWQVFWQDSLQDKGIPFYEIPMMSGGFWLASGWINSGMRSGLDAEMQRKVACFYGAKLKYAEVLNIEDITECYVCVLDESGKIIYSSTGEITDEKKRALLASID